MSKEIVKPTKAVYIRFLKADGDYKKGDRALMLPSPYVEKAKKGIVELDINQHDNPNYKTKKK